MQGTYPTTTSIDPHPQEPRVWSWLYDDPTHTASILLLLKHTPCIMPITFTYYWENLKVTVDFDFFVPY